MKYQIGDTVILLQTDEEGTIVEFINSKMVTVEVNGVRFPVHTDQIDFPYFRMFTKAKKPEKRKLFVDDLRREKQPPRVPTHAGVFLSFLPVYQKDVFDDDVVEKLKLILINQNGDDYVFSYEVTCKGAVKFVLKNEIRAASEFYLHDMDFEEMSDNPRFAFDFSLSRPRKTKAPHFESEVKLTAKQLFKKIEESRLKNEPSFSSILFKEYPDRADAATEQLDLSKLTGKIPFDIAAAARYLEPPRSVVDLHIEKLRANPAIYKAPEIFVIQMEAFEKYFDLARAHRLPEMIVIHGIGEGKLKQEIHNRLKNREGVKSFVNRQHPQYGAGATEIRFSY